MPDETGEQQGYGHRRPWPPYGSDPEGPVGQAPPWPTNDRPQHYGSAADTGPDWFGDGVSDREAANEAADRFARERFELYGRNRPDDGNDDGSGYRDPYRQPDQRDHRELYRREPAGRAPYPADPADPADPRDPRDPQDPYGRDPYGRGPDGYGRHPDGPREPTDAPRGRRRIAGRGRSLAATLGLTVLGTLLPGSGLLAAGRRLAGGLVLGVFLLTALVGGGYALFRQRALMRAVLDAEVLGALGVGLFLVGLAWVGVIVATHRSLRSRMATPLDRIIGAVVVALLAVVVIAPLTIGSRYAFVSRDLVSSVFAGEDSKSATRPQNVTEADPWAGNDRVNILLLGGDGAANRDGIRTDTVMIASIDTDTGNAVLFSLPRNLQKLPFPPDSPLAEKYPDGVFDEGEGWEDPEYFLNALYRNVPAQNPGALGETDNEGADAMKLAVGEALGLQLDYYVLINLAGFERLIDALGGITVNINTRVAKGGNDELGIPPSDWLEPGPNQHLNGDDALWYARGRYGASNYQRMQRQRCAMDAIIDKAQPGELLRRYEAIANSSKDLVQTDIPGTLLSAFVDLSLQVKNAEVTSIVFDDKVVEEPWDPDYIFIREKVQKAIDESTGGGSNPANQTGGQDGTSDGSDNAGTDGSDTGEPDTGGTDGAGGTDEEKGKADPIATGCDYQPNAEN